MTFNHKNNLKDVELCILKTGPSPDGSTPDLNNFIVDPSSQFSPLVINPIENGAFDYLAEEGKDKAVASDYLNDYYGGRPFLPNYIPANLQSGLNINVNIATSTYINKVNIFYSNTLLYNSDYFFNLASNILNLLKGSFFIIIHDGITNQKFNFKLNGSSTNYLPQSVSSTSNRKVYIFEYNANGQWEDKGENIFNYFLTNNPLGSVKDIRGHFPHKYYRRYSFILERGYQYHIELYWAGTQITNIDTDLENEAISPSSILKLSSGKLKRLGLKMFSSNFSHYDLGLVGKSSNRYISAATGGGIEGQNSSKKYYTLIEKAYNDLSIYIDYNVENLLSFEKFDIIKRNPSLFLMDSDQYYLNRFDNFLNDILNTKKYSSVNNLNLQSRLIIWRIKI